MGSVLFRGPDRAASSTYPVDLHVHTDASGGRDAVAAVMRRAAERGVRVLAIADHSPSDSYWEARRAGVRLGVELPFPALEISTRTGADEHHVLVYGEAALDPMLRAYAAFPTDRGPDRHLDTAEAIRVVRRAGGVPVLAHPFREVATRRSTPERLLAQVEAFVAAGLCGTEVRSTHHPDDAIPGGLDLPGRFGLLEFGGSDHHAGGRCEPGQVGVDWTQFARIRRLVADARPIVHPAPRFEAVTFDCGGTLIEHRRDPAGVIADAGLPPLDGHHRALLGTAESAALVVRQYTDPANWRVFPEVPAVLGALRLSGVRLGVIANWQSDLPRLLEAHGLLGMFDFVVASAAAGAAKPDRAIFDRAVELAGCPPDRVLHVGDHPECDVAGATAAGLAALHADRADPSWDLRRVLGHVLWP